MRIANRLLLGATVLVWASAPLLAQTGARPAVPAVPAQPGRQALATPAPKPMAATAAPTAAPASAAPNTDDPPTTDDVAAPTASDAPPSASAEPPSAAPPSADAPVSTPKPVAAPASTAAPVAAAPTASGKPPAVPPKGAAAQTASAAPATSAAPDTKTEDTASPAPAEPAEPEGNPDDSNSIVATVNDQSISDYEVRQRVALYLATSGINQQLTPDQKKRIRSQILESLEAEKIQLQEAVKKKITVSPVEVDKRINAMMTDNKFTIEQLRETLTKAGASEEALRAQITASIAWMKTVQDEYGDRVNITPEMVDAEMARHAEGANKPHYRVLEIFLPVENPEQDAKVKKDAEEIIKQLHQGAPFPMVARQFSQHPTAATNGDMGWVNDGQLAPELNDAVRKLEVGGMTDPIRSTGGYYILALRERQEPMGTKIDTAPKGPTGPAGTLPLARLLFPVSPKAPKAELDNIMNVANQITQRYQGCASLEGIHKQLTGTVYMDLGNAKLEELSPQIQKAMANTGPGEAAQPFMSEAGIELIARCDKRPEIKTAYVMPTRQQVEDQLFQNQISALARRYLRDLKRAANIQVRDETQPDALIR
jgi:peptidyl-prolyl cis-trans isomerase SurA